ncbi:hypothetical protein D1007_34357 [Hordeum vulgare]|nr:hypothetical protein D1007_34357 [Hordeum vulgare]
MPGGLGSGSLLLQGDVLERFETEAERLHGLAPKASRARFCRGPRSPHDLADGARPLAGRAGGRLNGRSCQTAFAPTPACASALEPRHEYPPLPRWCARQRGREGARVSDLERRGAGRAVATRIPSAEGEGARGGREGARVSKHEHSMTMRRASVSDLHPLSSSLTRPSQSMGSACCRSNHRS